MAQVIHMHEWLRAQAEAEARKAVQAAQAGDKRAMYRHLRICNQRNDQYKRVMVQRWLQ